MKSRRFIIKKMHHFYGSSNSWTLMLHRREGE